MRTLNQSLSPHHPNPFPSGGYSSEALQAGSSVYVCCRVTIMLEGWWLHKHC